MTTLLPTLVIKDITLNKENTLNTPVLPGRN